MYAMFKKDYIKPMTFSEIRSRYSYFTIICAAVVEDGENMYLPLAFTDRNEDGGFGDALDAARSEYPEYQITYIDGENWENAHPACGRIITTCFDKR